MPIGAGLRANVNLYYYKSFKFCNIASNPVIAILSDRHTYNIPVLKIKNTHVQNNIVVLYTHVYLYI
jgi:hypothetical protein